MKNMPFTIYVSESVLRDLNAYIPNRKKSAFVVALLEDAIKTKKEEIAKSFRQASRDNIRNSEISMWSALEEDTNG